ncbi:accessory factor UbiK family protein [Chromohalobacter salexigens]|nr:accessory factor UbiK family protein [Chromohalobacter salexigens]
MATHDLFSRLAQQVGDRLQDASHAPEDIQRSVQGVMRGAFDRMELVSREDFDILMEVLQRTRSRVESLEAQVAALEAALDVGQSAPVAAAEGAEPATAHDAKGDADEASASDTSRKS